MSVGIRVAWSLEQILRSQLMKRLFDVFDAEGDQNLFQISHNRSQDIPIARPAVEHGNPYICMCTKHTT